MTDEVFKCDICDHEGPGADFKRPIWKGAPETALCCSIELIIQGSTISGGVAKICNKCQADLVKQANKELKADGTGDAWPV